MAPDQPKPINMNEHAALYPRHDMYIVRPGKLNTASVRTALPCGKCDSPNFRLKSSAVRQLVKATLSY